MKITNIFTISLFTLMLVVTALVLPGIAKAYYTGACIPNYQQMCSGNNLYWYDSCGNQQTLAQTCSNGCYNNSCQNYNNYNNNCTSNYQQRCAGNNLYWFDSCGNQQTLAQTCSNGCYNNICQDYNNNYNNCSYHSYQQCVGNNLYWYNSCGVQQDLAQYCSNGCYNNSCQNYNNNNNNYNYNNYGNCTYHAYRLCVNNTNVYWYDSCGTQQDLYLSCSGGQVCNNQNQYGQCAPFSIINPVLPPIQPIEYIAYYKKACYGSIIYWYDSFGTQSAIYKRCKDNNSCTIDTCANITCANTLKCDGSTCASGSADYNKYCAGSQPASQGNCGNGLCETTLGETTANCPADCKINTNTNTNNNASPTNNTNTTINANTNATGLLVSFFDKQDSASTQWQKTAQIGSNGQIYFMISVANTSANQLDDVSVLANIPSEIYSIGNLQLNGVLISGDIISGVNIGSLSPSSAKSITFEGKTQTILANSVKQATATANVSGTTQSDTVSIDLNPTASANAAAVSTNTATATSGFWAFLKRWYLWILVGLVLIFLFIVVFKRLSSDV